jgi:hypothetical protein
VAISVSDAYQAARKGRLLKAASHLLDRRNFTSVRAIWEDRKWIQKV